MDEANAIKGSTDAELFETYIEAFLAPTLEAGQVVVLDGLEAPRTNKVRELIEEWGAKLVFLPSCSPDLNPIEEAFSKIKNIVGSSERAPAMRSIMPSRRRFIGHARRRGGMVFTLRLRVTGSILIKTAVRATSGLLLTT
jgi:transposase